EHLMLFDIHHIIADGLSMAILLDEFGRLYRNEQLPELRIQYKEFAVWQNKRLSSGELDKQLDYWKQALSGTLPVLNLPTDYPRPAVQTYDGDFVSLELDKDCWRRLNKLAEQN